MDVDMGASAEGGGGSEGQGSSIISMERPIKAKNTFTKRFTKHFYVKLYAQDWVVTPDTTGTSVVGWMNWIPYQALCMYLSPGEYMKLVRDSNYATVKEAKFQMEFKAVRTPFDANVTDAAEANGNLQFEIQRFDGLEKMLPFNVVDRSYNDANSKLNVSHAELIQRLYGITGFGRYTTGTNSKLPAVMRERGFTYRPQWGFESNSDYGSTAFGSMYRNYNLGISALPIGEFVSERLNTNQVKMGEGYCFNKVYKPKNGLITAASSAFCTRRQNPSSRTRVNVKSRFQDGGVDAIAGSVDATQYLGIYPIISNDVIPIEVSGVGNLKILTPGATNIFPSGVGSNSCTVAMSAEFPGVNTPTATFEGPAEGEGVTYAGIWQNARQVGWPPVDVVSMESEFESQNDTLGYGYNNAMAYYTIADLENYSEFPSHHDPPLHKMESFLLGAVPKTNKDNTIVNATMEFEITTEIVVEISDCDNTYINCAYNVFADDGAVSVDGVTPLSNNVFMDQHFVPATGDTNNGFLYGGKWQHNEHDVTLRDPKFWNKGYGRAAKPLFQLIPADTPMLK